MMSRSKRKTSEDWLIGHGSDLSLAIGNKLPLKRNVMKRCLHIRQTFTSEKKFPKVRDVFLVVYEELSNIWDRSGILMKPIKDCLDYLVKIHDMWSQLSKIPTSRQSTENAVLRIKQLQDSLNVLCDFSPSNVFELLRSSRNPHWMEDYGFLLGQQKFPQVGSLGSFDRKNARRVTRKQMRSFSENLSSNIETPQLIDFSEESSTDDDDTSEDYQPNLTPIRPKSVTLGIPTKNLMKITGQVADSRNLSIRDHLVVQAQIVNAGGGNIDQISMSISTTWRQRNANRKEIAVGIQSSFIIPKKVVVHYDSKLIE